MRTAEVSELSSSHGLEEINFSVYTGKGFCWCLEWCVCVFKYVCVCIIFPSVGLVLRIVKQLTCKIPMINLKKASWT